jgi:hypothetical protein
MRRRNYRTKFPPNMQRMAKPKLHGNGVYGDFRFTTVLIGTRPIA